MLFTVKLFCFHKTWLLELKLLNHATREIQKEITNLVCKEKKTRTEQKQKRHIGFLTILQYMFTNILLYNDINVLHLLFCVACPMPSKKHKYEEGQRIKRAISKNVNRLAEEELRSLATDSKKTFLSKKKKQVAQTVTAPDPKPKDIKIVSQKCVSVIKCKIIN